MGRTSTLLWTFSMKLCMFLDRSVMPMDLTLVLRYSANWLLTPLASGGRAGRSLLGERALTSSSGEGGGQDGEGGVRRVVYDRFKSLT